jgi:hypothetical protein
VVDGGWGVIEMPSWAFWGLLVLHAVFTILYVSLFLWARKMHREALEFLRYAEQVEASAADLACRAYDMSRRGFAE